MSPPPAAAPLSVVVRVVAGRAQRRRPVWANTLAARARERNARVLRAYTTYETHTGSTFFHRSGAEANERLGERAGCNSQVPTLVRHICIHTYIQIYMCTSLYICIYTYIRCRRLACFAVRTMSLKCCVGYGGRSGLSPFRLYRSYSSSLAQLPVAAVEQNARITAVGVLSM